MTRNTRSRDGTSAPGRTRNRKHSVEPALQVICLASGGGPAEDNVTGFLVRSVSTKWNKNSVLAVDAGSHLASISRLLEADFPRVSQPFQAKRSERVTTPRKTNGSSAAPQTPGKAASEGGYESSDSSASSSVEPATRMLEEGPFAGLPFPFESARANALHVVRECVSTYLITHPHLDHLSAFAMNTAAFHNTSRPKRLAALPSTVNAIKTHIFNDVIWPNLTDEDGGVGFVTFQRLAEGGNVAVGEGRRRGFIEVCDGLCVKGMKISHGQCLCGPSAHRGSDVGLSHAKVSSAGPLSVSADSSTVSPTRVKRPSFSLQAGAAAGAGNGTPADVVSRPATSSHAIVVDSTAYFIQDDASGREILVFGDVEPDAISLNPRTMGVWSEAAPKIANGQLKAVIIECSYDDSQGDKILFGHLAPRWLVRELNVLADMVRLSKADRRASRKRKQSRRSADNIAALADEADAKSMLPPEALLHPDDRIQVSGQGPSKKGRTSSAGRVRDGEDDALRDAMMSPRSRPADEPSAASHRGSAEQSSVSSGGGGGGGAGATSSGISGRNSISLNLPQDTEPPLGGLTVIVMHIKDTLRDGPLVGETILKQLHEHEARLKEQDGVGLGCEFVISQTGGSYYF